MPLTHRITVTPVGRQMTHINQHIGFGLYRNKQLKYINNSLVTNWQSNNKQHGAREVLGCLVGEQTSPVSADQREVKDTNKRKMLAYHR